MTQAYGLIDFDGLFVSISTLTLSPDFALSQVELRYTWYSLDGILLSNECILWMCYDRFLSDSAPTLTHPHSSPPTPTQPKYFSIHPHPPKIMSYSPSHTQNNAPYTPTHPHPPKIMSHSPKITHTYSKYASIAVTYTKNSPLTYTYSNLSFITR